MRISLPFLAFALIGCSGTEPNFIYTSQQADEVNIQLEKLTSDPLQKYVNRVTLTDSDRDNLAEALPLLDRMIKWDPVTINAYAMKGKIHLALGEPQLAKEIYLDGIAKTIPRNTDLDRTIRSDMYVELAAMDFETNNIENAKIALQTAIQLSDTSPEAHVILGRIYLKEGRKSEAKEEALKAILINAEYEPARIFYREVTADQAASP